MKHAFFLGAWLFILTPRDALSQASLAEASAASEAVSAQARRPWIIRGELGQAEIHRAESKSVAFGVRLGRNLDRQGFARLDLGLSASSADEFYLVLDAGLELRLIPRSRVTPFLGGRAGYLVESEWAGIALQGGGGLNFTLAPSAGLQLAIYSGTHGGQMGPNLLIGGLEFRF